MYTTHYHVIDQHHRHIAEFSTRDAALGYITLCHALGKYHIMAI